MAGEWSPPQMRRHSPSVCAAEVLLLCAIINQAGSVTPGQSQYLEHIIANTGRWQLF